jgi:hypothetical protein
MVNSRLCCNGTQLIAHCLAELLYRLGLCRYPPLETIITLSSTAPDTTVRETAFKYLGDNLRSKYSHYDPDNFRHIAFIPAENKDGTCLEKLGNVRCFFPTVLPANVPFQVFLGTRWKALGFSVIQDSYRKDPVTELGVQQHPPTSALIRLLETTPPTDEETARQWFESLFECIPGMCSFILPRRSLQQRSRLFATGAYQTLRIAYSSNEIFHCFATIGSHPMLRGRSRRISHEVVCLCGFRFHCKPLFEGLRLEE